MSIYLKFLRLFLVLMLGVFFLVGCEPDDGGDKKTDSPSQNEPSSNVENGNNQNSDSSSENESTNQDNSSSSQSEDSSTPSDSDNGSSEDSSSNDTTYADKTEKYEVYAEIPLVINIDIPLKIYSYSGSNGTKTEQLGHFNINVDENKITFIPKNGFIGRDTFSIEFLYHIDGKVKIIKRTYQIDVLKRPLEGYRDFTISKYCTDNYLHIDIDFVDNNLNILKKLYDDKESNYEPFPFYSRIQIDYHGEKDKVSINHHQAFKENLDKNFLLTCNYPNGYKRLMLPISSSQWYATRPHKLTNRHFERNDLYLYISHLSELYIQIYLKEYQKTLNYDNSFEKASQFMEKTFPNAHYTAEFAKEYNTLPHDPVNNEYGQLYIRFEEDNKKSIDKLYNLSQEVTNNNVFKLVKKIADNYESFYLSDNHHCLDKTICATFFPEYVTSVTNNPSFKNGFEGWIKNEEIHDIATGKIEYLPQEDMMSVELRANIPSSANEPISSIDLYQTKVLNDDTIDDYFLYFDLANVLGAADGGASFLMCTASSGFTGAYALFRDKNNKQIGLLAWTDHCNKFDFNWFGRTGIDSTDRFYNNRLRNVIRRVNPSEKRFEYTVSIGELTKKYLPIVYAEKDKIYSIEYGIFTTEHRSSSNGCYFCDAKIKAHEINLLKIK